MDLQESFDEFERKILSSDTPGEAFRELCGLCNVIRPHEVWQQLAALDVESDIENLETWLRDLLAEEKPPVGVKAFWFGMFDGFNDENEPVTVMYVGGSEEFDEEDETFEWAVEPAWFPEGRHAESTVLAELARQAEALAVDEDDDEDEDDEDWEDDDEDYEDDEEDEDEDDDDEDEDEEEEDDLEDEIPDFDTLISYFMTLGYGALAVGHLCRTLGRELLGEAKTRVVAVGFDDGDAIVLGELRPDGWHQIDIER